MRSGDDAGAAGGDPRPVDPQIVDAPDATDLGPGERMVQLAFTDGFRSDQVVIRVDGADVQTLDGVTTQALLGLAQEVMLRFPDRPATIEIEVLSRGLRAAETIEPDVASIAVALEGDHLTVAPHGQTLGFA